MFLPLILKHSISQMESKSGGAQNGHLASRRPATLRIVLCNALLVGLVIYPVSKGLAHCNDAWSEEYKALEGCGGNSPPQRSYPIYRGPSAAEIAAQQAAAAQRQREAAATAQNEQGIKAHRNGNYARALAYFEKALEIS